MRVNWTDPALNALDDIHDYISRDAPHYAQHFIRLLMAAVDRLEQPPLSGRSVPEAERDDVREVIFQCYRIIYWVVNDERVDIVDVMHSSRDLSDASNQPWPGG